MVIMWCMCMWLRISEGSCDMSICRMIIIVRLFGLVLDVMRAQ